MASVSRIYCNFLWQHQLHKAKVCFATFHVSRILSNLFYFVPKHKLLLDYRVKGEIKAQELKSVMEKLLLAKNKLNTVFIISTQSNLIIALPTFGDLGKIVFLKCG